MDIWRRGRWKLWATWGGGCYGIAEYGFRLMVARDGYQPQVYDDVLVAVVRIRRGGKRK